MPSLNTMFTEQSTTCFPSDPKTVYSVEMDFPMTNALHWMEQKKWDQKRLAAELGCDTQNITNWKTRGMPAARFKQVADVFGKSVDELLAAPTDQARVASEKYEQKIHSLAGQSGSYLRSELASLEYAGKVAGLHPEEDLPDGYIQIRESQVRFAAGNGHVAQFDEIEESVPATFRLDWFRREGIKPENARRFKVKGESMAPLLHDGDTVLVNLAETGVIDGKVYAIRYGDELRIKRIFKRLDGGLILHSDNPEHRPRDEELTPTQSNEHIAVIGRVRDKSGSGGL